MGGIAEIVQDGVNGFLVAKPSASPIAARVAQVFALPPDALRQVTAAGRAAYETQFTIERYRRRILDIYFQI